MPWRMTSHSLWRKWWGRQACSLFFRFRRSLHTQSYQFIMLVSRTVKVRVLSGGDSCILLALTSCWGGGVSPTFEQCCWGLQLVPLWWWFVTRHQQQEDRQQEWKKLDATQEVFSSTLSMIPSNPNICSFAWKEVINRQLYRLIKDHGFNDKRRQNAPDVK